MDIQNVAKDCVSVRHQNETFVGINLKSRVMGKILEHRIKNQAIMNGGFAKDKEVIGIHDMRELEVALRNSLRVALIINERREGIHNMAENEGIEGTPLP